MFKSFRDMKFWFSFTIFLAFFIPIITLLVSYWPITLRIPSLGEISLASFILLPVFIIWLFLFSAVMMTIVYFIRSFFTKNKKTDDNDNIVVEENRSDKKTMSNGLKLLIVIFAVIILGRSFAIIIYPVFLISLFLFYKKEKSIKEESGDSYYDNKEKTPLALTILNIFLIFSLFLFSVLMLLSIV